MQFSIKYNSLRAVGQARGARGALLGRPGHRHAARGLLPSLLLLALLWPPGLCYSIQPPAKTARHPTRLIVRFAEAPAFAASAGSSLKVISPQLHMYTFDIRDGSSPEAKAAQLRKLQGVLYAEVDPVVQAAGVRSRQLQQYSLPRQAPPPPLQTKPKPRYAIRPQDAFWKLQWGAHKIRAQQAWGYQKDAVGVKVCVIDSGVKWDHADLKASLVRMPQPYQLNNTDQYGHGTHVAGIIGAVRNRRGTVGVALNSTILPCKVLDELGFGYVSDVIKCINICRAFKTRIINVSLVIPSMHQGLAEAFRGATNAGIFVASAAGNSFNDNDLVPFYPANLNLSGLVAVANLDTTGMLRFNSNYGRRTVHLAAPGNKIVSTYFEKAFENEYYAYLEGSSMACAYVSGAAALALAASGGTLTNTQLKQLLIATSQPLDGLRNRVVSNGVINVEALVLAAWRLGLQLRYPVNNAVMSAL